MPNWRLAKSLVTLRTQINALYPNRDKASDGSIGDVAHQKAGTSDHLPNNAGVVTAIDIDEDLAPGVTVVGIVAALQASKDARLKYLIYESRITVKGDVTRWKPYNGANAHKHHVHISVSSSPTLYDDDREWNVSGAAAPIQPAINFKFGDKGVEVKTAQAQLIRQGYLVGKADGLFGPATKKAVQQFQADHGLRDDGIIGPMTAHELFK